MYHEHLFTGFSTTTDAPLTNSELLEIIDKENKAIVEIQKILKDFNTTAKSRILNYILSIQK